MNKCGRNEELERKIYLNEIVCKRGGLGVNVAAVEVGMTDTNIKR